MSAAVVAFGAVSAMGEGASAASAGEVGARARVCIARDPELEAAGLARPFAARAALTPGEDDRATMLLRRATDACVRELDASTPGWRTKRVGVALGTSSGGMRTAESVFEACLRGDASTPRDQAARALYFGPMVDALGSLGLDMSPATLVMGACAASTLAIGLGLRWLEADECDLVLAGGFDAISTFVAAGFEALRATTATVPPRPFRVDRDGMTLGEGAAVLALVPSRAAMRARVHVVGFGASSDAVHLTAPDREGKGLAAAAGRALREAAIVRPDLVSPHGSATPFSDAAEVRALDAALADRDVVVHPLKAQIGHTLGASGALEVVGCIDALSRGVYPAAAGAGLIDPDAQVRLLDVALGGSPRTALKLSAAFGGANAALALATTPAGEAAKASWPVYLRRAVHVDAPPPPLELAALIGWPVDRVHRADLFTRRVLAAVAALVARDGSLRGAGIVLGTTFATMETNAAFFARIRERGARMAEPRRFPYTSPNAAAGDAGVAFGLTGPGFAVGSGLHAALEALVVASHLVRSGDAAAIVVVGADDLGATTARIAGALGVDVPSGAIALVVSRDASGAIAEVTRATSGTGVSSSARGRGLASLAPLLAPLSPPDALEASSPSLLDAGVAGQAWARVELRPVTRI